MRVKCVASIAPILYRSELESVVEPQTIPVREMREALLLGEWFVSLSKDDGMQTLCVFKN